MRFHDVDGSTKSWHDSEDIAALDPCKRSVRAHVVIDATGNKYDAGCVLIAHTPDIVMIERFDADKPGADSETRLAVMTSDTSYRSKVRGWRDLDLCNVA